MILSLVQMPRYAVDSVLVANAFKAMKRALKKVTDNLPYANDDTTRIFSKPIVRVLPLPSINALLSG